MGEVNNYDVMKRMGELNRDIRLAPLDNITNMRMTKHGTKVTIGVQGNVLKGIALGQFYGGLILMDREQFEATKKELAAAAGTEGKG